MTSPVRAFADLLIKAAERFLPKRDLPPEKPRWRVVVSDGKVDHELFVYADLEYEVRPIVLSSRIQDPRATSETLISLMSWEIKLIERDETQWKPKLYDDYRPARETRGG